MARPKKCRKICCLPENNIFGPPGTTDNTDCVEMSIDEYETIRLIDFEHFSQQECAEQMQVARTTVQSIYDNARQKLAQAIVMGKALKISGGSYILCSGSHPSCRRKVCCRYDIFSKKGETF